MWTVRVLESVLPSERIEVRTGGGERSRAAIAQAHGMEMNAMSSWWKSEAADLDVYQSTLVLPQLSRADRSSVDVVKDCYRSRDRVARSLRRSASGANRDHEYGAYEERPARKNHLRLRRVGGPA